MLEHRVDYYRRMKIEGFNEGFYEGVLQGRVKYMLIVLRMEDLRRELFKKSRSESQQYKEKIHDKTDDFHEELLEIRKTGEGKMFVDLVSKYRNLRVEQITDHIWKESEYWHSGL